MSLCPKIVVTTQQGTGTFISDKKIELSEVEREKVLSDIARTFVTKVQSYGFTIQDIIDYLAELNGNKEGKI